MARHKNSKPIWVKTRTSAHEVAIREEIQKLFRACPLPEDELFNNLNLFIRRQQLGKILFMDYLYRQILDVHGIVAEFGVRWGRNLALFESLRGMYEPFNHNRKIVGFDTWGGSLRCIKKMAPLISVKRER